MDNYIVAKGKSKTGRSFIIRYPGMDDIQDVCDYINKLSRERTYIRFQGEEISLEEESKYLKGRLSDISQHKSVHLFLIIDGKVHGVCGIDLFDKTENHIALLGLSVDQSVRGEGLGEILLRTTIEESRKHLTGLKIIRLEVKEPNFGAKKLYEKVGFKQFGYLPNGTSHQDSLTGEFFMYLEV